MPRTSLAERQARLAQQRAKLQTEEQSLREAERKARTRTLIAHGGLIEKTGLGRLEPDALYGALLSLVEPAADAAQVARWTALGGRAFAHDARLRDAAREPLVLTFAGPLPTPVSTRLRALGFRWSKVMAHWEGMADPQAAGEIARDHGGTVRQVGTPPAASDAQ